MDNNIQSNFFDGLNDEQKEAAFCTKNSVVAAGAGSGKTHVLSKRYVYLVTEKNLKVEQILTLTFTKKAASEMYQRIFQDLSKFAETTPGVLGERAKNAIDNFTKARIQTLDSYCKSIITSAVHHYGIRPDFSVDKDVASDDIEKSALPFVLKNIDNPNLKALIQTDSPENIASDLFARIILNFSTLSNPIDFKNGFEKQKAEALSKWKELSEKASIILDEVQSGYDNNPDALGTEKFFDAYKECKKNEIDSPEIDFENIDEKSIEEYCDYIYSIAYINGKSVRQDYKGLFDELRKTFVLLSSLANFFLNYSMLSGVIPLLEDFQNEVNEKRRSSGHLTFADVASLAICVLRDFKDIRQAEKQTFKAIMIDEFQDDNQLQRDLLFFLSEKDDVSSNGVPKAEDLNPEKLFFVGDEKQSIYKFRGADVSVFRKLSSDLHNEKELSLIKNYRSEPPLIASFNAIFGGSTYPPYDTPVSNIAAASDSENLLPSVFEKPSDSLPVYEATYHNVEATEKTEYKEEDYTPCVHVCSFGLDGDSDENEDSKASNDDEEDDEIGEILNSVECEALFVAKEIRKLIDSGTSAKDIVILFRVQGKQKTFEKYLRDEKVPYASTAVTGFFYDAPVNDLYAFMRLCVYPEDTLSYATVLCSPFVRLEKDSVQKIFAKNRNEKTILPFNKSDEELLSQKEIELFRSAKLIYEDAVKSMEKTSNAEFVTSLWYALGYRYETLWNQTVNQYNELYDYLFELACRADLQNQTLAGFVDSLSELNEANRKLEDMDIPLERGNAVQLMTVHASKGLQFEVVFLVQCAAKELGERQSGFVSYSNEFGVSLNAPMATHFLDNKKARKNYFFDKFKEENTKMINAENKRLLYVAITRAIKSVYLVGAFSADLPKDDGTVKALNFAKLLVPVFAYYELGNKNKTVAEPVPFTEINIPIVNRKTYLQSLMQNKFNKRANSFKERIDFVATAEEQYENAVVQEKELILVNKRNPSQLHFENNIYGNETIAQSKNVSVFDLSEIDKIVESFSSVAEEKMRFTYADFGTVAHAFVESLFKKEMVFIPNRILGILSNTQIEKVKTAAENLAKAFMNSELGKLACSAPWLQNEYPFKTKINVLNNDSKTENVFIDGTIDLLFEIDDTVYVVDFKSDRIENPEEHFAQLVCYKKAVSQMRLGKKIRSWLFYFRTANAVEITKSIENIAIEDLCL